MPNETQKRVLYLLHLLPTDGLAAAKQLFWTELNHVFDVEAGTRKFFSDYRQLFEAAEAQIVGLEGEDLRLFTQLRFRILGNHSVIQNPIS
jgi:hypothetical protein